MKKLFKRLVCVVILAILIVIFGNIYGLYMQYISLQNQAEKKLNYSVEQDLEENLLLENLNKSNNFVKSVSNESKLVLLTITGNYNLMHDRTSENIKWSEWLINSQIELNLKYELLIGIKANNIAFRIMKDGSVNAHIDSKNIEMLSLELKDVTSYTNYSILGKRYTPREIVSLEKIAKDSIATQVFNESNIQISKNNLKLRLEQIATSFNVAHFTVCFIE